MKGIINCAKSFCRNALVILLLYPAYLKAVQIEKHSFSSLFAYSINEPSSVCGKKSQIELLNIQKRYGLEIANSAYLCSSEKNSTQISAFLPLDPGTQCALFIQDDSMIDPCSGRLYGLKGECLQEGCTNQLIRLFVNKIGDNTFFLPTGYPLQEFQEPSLFEGESREKQLETALSLRAYKTVKKLVMENQIDVLTKLGDGSSLLEYYLKRSNWGEFDEFMRLTKSIDRKVLANEHLLEIAMTYNKFQIAKFIISLGTSTERLCEVTSEYEITKIEMLGCEDLRNSSF